MRPPPPATRSPDPLHGGHHVSGDALVAQLRQRAAAEGAVLVTTAKDAARLSQSNLVGVCVVDVELEWLSGATETLDRLLDPLLGPRH